MKGYRIVVASLVFFLLASVVLNIPGFAKATNDLSQVAYYNRVKNVLNLTAQQEAMLQQNGFAIVPVANNPNLWLNANSRFEDFYYGEVYTNDLPVFVTTDSILQLFHVVFDCSLRMQENQTFYPMIFDVTQYAFTTSLSDYNSIQHDGSLRYWAIRNATVYFAVAMSLISGMNATLPSELTADLAFYLNQIYAETPQFLYAGSWNFPEPPYSVDVQYDFTQFTVRGHYLGVPKLEQYFRTMMWYGNFPIFVPRNDEIYIWSSSHIDDLSMVYMRDILKANPYCYNEWLKLYNVTSALVGESDSINPLSLETALHSVFGNANQYLNNASSPGGLTALQTELAKPEYEQRILSKHWLQR
jgi:hypothetical protein